MGQNNTDLMTIIVCLAEAENSSERSNDGDDENNEQDDVYTGTTEVSLSLQCVRSMAQSKCYTDVQLASW